MQLTKEITYGPNTVLQNIHQLRRRREYSQDFMAYKLGISQNAYSKLECGKTPLTMVRFFKIAEILEESPSRLMDARTESVPATTPVQTSAGTIPMNRDSYFE